ncbi:MAG: EscT/YscT/HrcT family type secretion system export apparatus protein [Fibrobacteres bacterium]|nr:EscT/YscT/HrcT family type secretion system export apparatus protein [Fibrobacterota bacterium]
MEVLLTYALAMVMAAPRLLGLHLSLPMFSQGVIPSRVRSGLSLSLGLFVMPMILAQGQPPASLIAFAAIALKEFFLGFAFGFPLALYNFAAQSAGDLISFQSGASMSAFFDPASHEEITPMGNLLKRYAEVLFFISGAYTLMLGALFESYRIWPVGSYFPDLTSVGADFWATAIGHYFASACMLAFPALACMFLITFCMGLIGRYLPQLNVFFVAMPLQCLAACLVLILSFPIYAHLFKAHFAGIEEGLATLRLVFGKH